MVEPGVNSGAATVGTRLVKTAVTFSLRSSPSVDQAVSVVERVNTNGPS